jgi:hypothetical protein
MNYVVKPLYLREGGVTVQRLYLVYDADNPVYDERRGRRILRPNYAIDGTGNVISELTRHFESKKVSQTGWRVTPPILASKSEGADYLGTAEILAG